MKTIGIFTAGWGHESIARAIAEKITKESKNKYKIKLFFRKETLDILYNSLYRFSPSSLGLSFFLASKLTDKNKRAKKLVESYFSINEEKKIREFIKKNQIDLCINTYLFCNPVLEKIKAEGIPLINIIADPKTPFNLEFSNTADVNLTFDNHLVKTYKAGKAKESGWFVRKQFEEDYDQKEIRKKLKLDDNLTILVASGSEGSSTVLKILPSIINCNKKVNFVIACGNNKFLYDNTVGIKKSLEKLSSSQAKVIPLGFTKKIHLYMQAADLVIGKAGPNTLFESVACETAFFAITHIHGQENGNLEIIEDYQIGIVEENTRRANQKLSKLIEHPEEIAKFTPHLKALKKHNQNSINVLLKIIEKLLT